MTEVKTGSHNILQVGCKYYSPARGWFTVESYEPHEPSELRYTCSDGMYRDKHGHAFPEPLDESQKMYSVVWTN